MFRNLSTGTIGVLILAVLAGLIAAYGVRGALRAGAPEEAAAGPRVYQVPLASADLPEGREIVLGDIALIPKTYAELEKEGWANTRVMLSAEQIMGRRLRSPHLQGRPFMTTDFYLEGQRPQLTALLKPGFRAVSVQVSLERGGYVEAGSVVDVLFRAFPREATETSPAIPETTRRLVEAAEVLGVERVYTVPHAAKSLDLRKNNMPPEDETPPTIVLAVSIADSNRIEAVRGKGDISLTTAPQGEVRTARKPPPTSLEEVLEIDPLPPPSPPVAAATPYRTEIYRRGSRSVNEFPPSPPGVAPSDGPSASSSGPPRLTPNPSTGVVPTDKTNSAKL